MFNYRALRDIGFDRPSAILVIIARAIPILALLAAIFLWQKWRILLPIYAILTYSTFLHALTHAEARLSEPLQPLLFVLLAGAITTVASKYELIKYRSVRV